MKALILFAKEWSKIILPVVLAIVAAVWWLNQKRLRRKHYVADTLRKNGLTTERSEIYRNKIKWPKKSSDSFKSENTLICQLFENPRIINFHAKNHTVYFQEAKFPDRVPLNLKPKTIEVGRDQDNAPFSLHDANLIARVSTGGGKSVLYNCIIHSVYKSEPAGSFEIILCDPHQSFSRLKGVDGIDVFEGEIEDKQRFLERLNAIKDYQRGIDLSFYETLAEAKANGQMMDKKTFFILIDEFSELFSNANSKESDYAVNQAILATLKDLITSGRKYGQRVMIAFQSPLNSQALLHPSIFQGQIFGYVDDEVADSKGLPLTHELLKQSGNFYYTSKRYPATFFRTAHLEKKALLDLLKGTPR